MQFNNVQVPGGLWTADTAYADFPFRADVPLSGVTANMIPDVMLDAPQAAGGKLAPVALCGEGYVRLYASAAQTAFAIPVVRVRKAVG